MKKSRQMAAALLCMMILAGCGNENAAGNRIESQNAVDMALQAGIDRAGEEQMEKNEMDISRNAESVQNEEIVQNAEGIEEGSGQEITMSADSESDDEKNVDIDLTTMSSDMVYATVYQIMITPEVYVGKTIKMKGSYYASWYQPTEKYYHYVLIADAAACCSQGIEFIWGDGEHVFPDEYPDYYAEVEVVGTFITYTEPDDPTLYCALKDATMKLAAF